MINKDKNSFWPIIFAIFLGNFLAILSTTTITVAFPVVMTSFDTNLSMVQWLMAGYLLATGVVAPIVGYMGDQLSYKRLYIIALVGFILTSFLCALAWNIQTLIIIRIIQGIFGGMIIPITMTIIYQVIDQPRQAQAMGLWSLSSMLAPVIGPTLGGWMIEYFGWQSLFLLNIPLGIVAVIIVIKFIPMYSLSTKKSFDLLGFLSVVLSSSSLLLAFSHGSAWGWGSWQTLSLLTIGILLLGFFILWELKREEPLLQLRVFKSSRFTYSLLINCIVTISMYAGTLLLPLYLQMVLNLSAMETGLIMLPGAISMAVASPIVGKYYNKLGPFKLVISGLFFIALSTVLLSTIDTDTSIYYIALLQLIRCVGIALCSMPLTNAAMSAIAKESVGHASSITNWARQGLASLSIGLFSSLVVVRTAHHLALDTVNNQTATSMGIADVFFIAFIIALLPIPLTFLLKDKKGIVNSVSSATVGK